MFFNLSNSLCRTRPSLVLVETKFRNYTVLLLAIAMYASHALLQTPWIPRNVLIDHEPAERTVDSFDSGVGRSVA